MTTALIVKYFVLGTYAMFCTMQGIIFTKKTRAERTNEHRTIHHLMATLMLTMATLSTLEMACEAYYCAAVPKRLFTTITQLHTVIFPLCAMIIQRLGRAMHITPKRANLHTAPFIAIPLLYLVTGYERIIDTFIAFYVLYCIIVCTMTIRSIMRYQKALKDVFSDTTGKTLRWVYAIIAGLALLFFFWLTETIHTESIPINTAYHVTSLIIWWTTCSMIHKQVLDVSDIQEEIDTNEFQRNRLHKSKPHTKDLQQSNLSTTCSKTNTTDPPQPTESIEASPNTGDTGDTGDAHAADDPQSKISTTIEQLMKENKTYLDPNLTSVQLAKMIGTNRTYLSLWFREHNTTFNDYINGFRLARAENMLRTTSESILDICAKCGFNHPNTFRNIFKEKFGCTPKDYRKEHLTT